MSERTHEASRAVRLSAGVYRRLLLVFPATFRRQYGAHMVQVFRDCCREAAHADGTVGLWRYWLIALGDLVVSAFAERRREEFSMSRATWIRLGSLAAIVGGTISALIAAAGLALAMLYLLDERLWLGVATFPFQLVQWEAAPAVWILYLLALVGLQTRVANRGGALGWVGITAGVMGALLIAVGNGIWAALVYSQAGGCGSTLNCNFYDPNHYAALSLGAQLLGAPVFALGMVLYSIAALRRHALPRRNALPLIVGVLALLNGATYIIALFVSYGTDGAGTQKVAMMITSVALLFAVAWILLGMAMWPHENEEAVVQAAA